MRLLIRVVLVEIRDVYYLTLITIQPSSKIQLEKPLLLQYTKTDS